MSKSIAAVGMILILSIAAGAQAPAGPTAFRVTVPGQPFPFPTPLPAGQSEPGFKIRGTKGWAWSFDQYLAEIPTLRLGRMNFLMSCYTSVFTDRDKFINRWWEPFSEETKKGLAAVARACRENGILFCFSFHPALFSDRPLRLDSEEDFEALWSHFAWVQGLGVSWFSLSYDDIDVKGQPVGALGAGHAGLADRLLSRLRAKDPKAQLIFCPTYYWGPGDTGEAKEYWTALGRELDKDVYLFWTGDAVVTPRITRAAAESFKKASGHRLILWDNYPVNDRTGALHLGPLTGREPGLGEVVDGYMSNPHCPQSEINRIPLLTCADYAYNPRAYDPARSIGRAVALQDPSPAGRQTLADLVGLYPGDLLSGSSSTAYNSAVETMTARLKGPGGREAGAAFLAEVEDVARRMERDFPNRYAETKKTVADHIAKLKAMTAPRAPAAGRSVSLSKAALLDKIRGGWAGQTIGCTFGGPTEFRFQGTIIPEGQPIPWDDGSIARAYKNSPGLYDDVYMDLTFVGILEKEGLEAKAASFAKAFAEAPYPLWHANQMARSNILRGLMPPASGHWRNNPHADDIDFQIEADFAGLMAPGLPNAAAEVCDRVGHIMNYGDGWYGGVYIAEMLALAFVETDIPTIAEKALRAVPAGSDFARAMRDVLAEWRENPKDWQAAWFRILRRYGNETGCPEGVFTPFDIDAKINAAWVLIGLLYGGGDFGRTIDIAARCGDDSDCNPASAAGILGVLRGLSGIPERWKTGLAAVEDIPFPYVGFSLRQAADLSFKHALAVVAKNGGQTDGDEVVIPVQEPAVLPLEVSFEGLKPTERRSLARDLRSAESFEIEGLGFAFNAETRIGEAGPSALKVEVWIDGAQRETVALPTNDHDRRDTPFWAYDLAAGRHTVRLVLINPAEKASVRLDSLIVYGPADRD
ncbi:MAG: beta-N-acetylglucosaminidase domain-containing protein [Acidobacteriota bacterium]|nr:beta-N-acetylglucosaminidase domain-containing protein [Acidobacteriota bacterium]